MIEAIEVEVKPEATPIEATPVKRTFSISCDWTMSAVVEVEADSLEAAIAVVQEGNSPYHNLPNGEYVEGSFDIDEDVCKELNKEE